MFVCCVNIVVNEKRSHHFLSKTNLCMQIKKKQLCEIDGNK